LVEGMSGRLRRAVGEANIRGEKRRWLPIPPLAFSIVGGTLWALSAGSAGLLPASFSDLFMLRLDHHRGLMHPRHHDL